MHVAIDGLVPAECPLHAHRDRLVAVVRRRLDPALAVRIDAEDVANVALAEAQARWRAEGPPEISVFPWLYGIARDVLIEAWRRETRGCRDVRREMPWPEGSSAQLGLDLVASATSPSEAFARAETRGRVQQLLGLLRPRDREVLWMRHNDGMTHREVAEVLGITEDAALQRYARAVRRFRDLWRGVEQVEGER